MHIKSNKTTNKKWRTYYKDLESMELISWLQLTSFMVFCWYFYIIIYQKSLALYEIYKLNKKYELILKNTPILQCNNNHEVKSTNYKILKIDDKPLIKVFYSDINIETYNINECAVIQEVFNADLDVKTIPFINNELKNKINNLEANISILKNNIEEKKLQIILLKEKNKKIKKDYKLPTITELDKLYDDYKKSKKTDIISYIDKIKKEQQRLMIAKSENEHIQNNYNQNENCSDETEFDMTNTRIYTLWLAGKCNEIRWILRNEKNNKTETSNITILKSYKEDPDAYIVHHNNQGGEWYEKK